MRGKDAAFLALAGLAGFVLARVARRGAAHHRSRAAMSEPTRPTVPRSLGEVRQAGPEEMRDPPGRWDPVDETADESFPASDPPGTY